MVTPDYGKVLDAVWADAEARGFAGWDPYDGLNSRLFRAMPFSRVPAARQAWIQLIKRSPVNLRPLVGQKPQVLAKGLSLFALGTWKLAAVGGLAGDPWRRRGTHLLELLLPLRSPGQEEICWGYPFDWQSRAFFQPGNSPNLICSVFGAMAFERRADGGDAATVPASVSRFILKSLVRQGGGETWITYTPTTDTQVHNVNMLGAALLARQARRGGGSAMGDLARATMKFSVERLRPNGSWPYGEAANQAWVDNFHTGYNLVALEEYRSATGETWMDPAFETAYRYWDRTFFKPDGAPSYYDNNHWPIDIHCSAQAILTYLECARLDPDAAAKARRVADWTLRRMWDGRRNFVFQRSPWYDNRVPQMRWGQAWMFRGLADLARSAGRASAIA